MKKTALTALKILVSAGILAYIFTRVVDIRHLWANLRQADLSLFLAGVAVYFLVQALSAYRWYLLLPPQGISVSYSRILSYYFLGMYFNFFLPSAIGGDVFRIYYLNKETARLSASTASVFLDRDIGMGGLLLVATVVATFAGTTFQGVPLAPLFALVGLAFLLANIAIFYRPTYNLIHRLLVLLKRKRADEKVQRIFDSVNCYRGRWGLLIVTILLSIGVQVGCVFVNTLSAQAIGLKTQHGWIDFLVFVPAIGLISMVPLSVNGTGWREASYLLFFQSVNRDADAAHAAAQAATLSLLWLGAVVITSLPGGVIYILRGARKDDRPPDSDDFLDERGEGEEIPALSGDGESVSTI
jgi:uncharacterized protein (TIRG00374 family)